MNTEIPIPPHLANNGSAAILVALFKKGIQKTVSNESAMLTEYLPRRPLLRNLLFDPLPSTEEIAIQYDIISYWKPKVKHCVQFVVYLVRLMSS